MFAAVHESGYGPSRHFARCSASVAFGADPKIVTSGLRQLASGEAAPKETVAWVGACTKSGQCIDACPQKAVGLDAMLLVRIAKQRAINETRQLPAKQDPSYFPRIKAFARLQLSDEELEKWL
jgi:ferredoxin